MKGKFKTEVEEQFWLENQKLRLRLSEAEKTIRDSKSQCRLVEEKLHKLSMAVEQSLVSSVNTDSLHASKVLRKSEEMLREAGRLAKLGGWEFDLKTNELIWTEETYRIHEVDPHIQPNLADGIGFYAPEARLPLMQALEQVRVKGVPFDLELPFITAKGRNIWVRSIGHAEQIEGETVRLYGVFQDITEHKLYEAILKESEGRLRDIIECNFDGMMVVDQDGMICMSNPAAADLLNKTQEDLAGSPFGMPVSTSESIAIDLIRLDNQLCTVEMRMNRILWMSNPAYLVSLRDITQHKRAEQEITRKNEELQILNAQKDKFFSIIAHDLKSPFNSIVGFSELLVEKISAKDIDAAEKYAGIIHESSKRAMELLTNLMEWSLSQTGRMEFNPGYFEMVEVVKNITLLFDSIAGQKSIAIIKNLPSKAPVFADRAMISTVMRNLISNAIKFTEPGGEIIISVEEGEKELTVSVKDSGIGISKKRIGKLFQISESFSTSGTHKEKGTGLGLILCKEFVEQHGGKIWVESEETNLHTGRRGWSNFCFTLSLNH